MLPTMNLNVSHIPVNRPANLLCSSILSGLHYTQGICMVFYDILTNEEELSVQNALQAVLLHFW